MMSRRYYFSLSLRFRSLLACLFVLIFLVLSDKAAASAVEQQDINQLTQGATLIFEGQVISRQARWNQDQTRIHTWVTFVVEEVIKGNWNENNITLRFSGGTVDGVTLRVAGMRYPQIDEQGIYFVESLENKNFNPLLGWEQGQFTYASDSLGELRVCTANGKPVKNLDMNVESPSRLAKRGVVLPSGNVISEGVALGVNALSAEQLDEAISSGRFKQIIRAMAGSKTNSAPIEE